MKYLEDCGVMVTSTAGYDSNANGRAERAVQFFQTKARTMLSSNIGRNFRRNSKDCGHSQYNMLAKSIGEKYLENLDVSSNLVKLFFQE